MKSGYEVAIKILHPHMSADQRIVARFRREGATLTALRDPHTVTTYELAEDDKGTLFIVMELLRGETLLTRFRTKGPMPWQQVVAMARAVCDSLAEAHAMGVVHRDLKPGNIFLVAQPDGNDFIKVLDFGIAKLMHDVGGEELTKNNEVVGTFEYISPEQIKGAEYSGRSDIYTLGVVMYEMITGTRPFAQSGPSLLVTILTTKPPPASERSKGLPPELDRVLAKCLEPEPADRFADVAELAAMFDILVPPNSVAVRAPDSLDEATNLLIRDEDAGPASAIAPRGWIPYATPVAGSPVAPNEHDAPTALHDYGPKHVKPATKPDASKPATKPDDVAPTIPESSMFTPPEEPMPAPRVVPSTRAPVGVGRVGVATPPPVVAPVDPRPRSPSQPGYVQPLSPTSGAPIAPMGHDPSQPYPQPMANPSQFAHDSSQPFAQPFQSFVPGQPTAQGWAAPQSRAETGPIYPVALPPAPPNTNTGVWIVVILAAIIVGIILAAVV